MYKLFIRPLLFLMSAEKAHYFTFGLMKFVFSIPFAKKLAQFLYFYKSPQLHKRVWGLDFPNPVGLAAGFDKNAVAIDEMATFGFGFIEIGTLTPKAQAGNPKPRLFRLKDDKAIINRMGFNNEGVEQAVKNLRKRKSSIIIGGNIGKNKDTPNEKATDDYVYCFEKLFDYVDYFVINVSSPNTPNLRALQEKEPLKALLSSLQIKNNQKKVPKPILLKIAPDLSNEQLDDIVEIILETHLSGVIASNTTLSRENLKSLSELTAQAGGLSGKPLAKRATEIIAYLHQKSAGKFTIIGVGGIDSPQDALEKIQAGASLVQIYTGFVYEGPQLIQAIKKLLASTTHA